MYEYQLLRLLSFEWIEIMIMESGLETILDEYIALYIILLI
jgi:hypothetical protein